MKTKFIILLAFAWLVATKTNAGTPNWSVNANQYQFSMNVTGVFVQNCAFITNGANKVGAFVGTELRGTADFSVTDGGNQLAFLTIYSNQSSGETVTFKIYNQATDAIVNLPVQVTFTENSFQGNLQEPFQFYTSNLITTNFTASRNVNDHTLSASSTCDDPGTTYTYSLVPGSGSADNALFTLNGNKLTRTNFLRTAFSVRVKATGSNGVSFERSFALTFHNTGVADVPGEQARIYPNPLSGNKLFIELPAAEIRSVKIFSAGGKFVGEYSLIRASTGSVSGSLEAELSPGIYFVEIETAEAAVLRKKVLKQ